MEPSEPTKHRHPESEGDRAAVEALFDRLLDLSSDERRAVLADSSLDPAVRARVTRLLALADDPPARLDEPVVSQEAIQAAAPDRRIGSYTVRGLIGAGAMGVVYRAEQERPRREVALKLMRAAVEGEAGARRFEREAQLLGRLQHPGIAQIFEFGTTELDTGRTAFIAMELVDGRPLLAHVETEGLDLRARVTLLRDLCDAVHHAHLRGVIHRDLKPSNVLVAGDGVVKVIDFGVARALEGDAERWRATLAGQVIGTLEYMSPEQVQGDIERLDARTDVYSLGAIGYEILSGRLPHDLSGLTVATAARTIAERDVPRLGVAAPACRGDLEWVIGRALEKEQDRRYQSAHALAGDLRHWLAHEPVEARPAGALYQLRRFTRRNRAMVAGAATTLVAILVGAAVAVNQAIENRALADAEEAARRKAEDRTAELERMTDALAAQLRAIDAHAVAEVLHAGLLDELQPALERGAHRHDLESVDMVGLALRGLDEGLFQPAVDRLTRAFPDDPATRARLLQSLADAELNVGLPAAAEEHFREVRSIYLEVDRGESTRSLLTLLDIAHTLGVRSRTEEALAVIAPHEDALVDAIDGTSAEGRYLRLRALVARIRGDLDAAATFYERALAALGELPDDLSPDALAEPLRIDQLATRADLGVVLCQLDRFDEGIPAMTAALDRLVDLQDPPASLAMMRWGIQTDLGVALCRSGRADEGEPLLVDAEAGATRELGANHTATAAARIELGQWYAETVRYAEAVPLLRAADEVLVREGGPGHPGRFTPLLTLTQCHASIGRLDDAAETAEALYDLTSTTLDDRPELRLHGILNLRQVALLLAARDDDPAWRARAAELTTEADALRVRR